MLVTDTVLISLIGACATVALAGVNGVFAIISNNRSKRNEDRSIRNETQLEANSNHLAETKAAVMQVQTQTDGMSKDLAKATGQREYTRGQHEGDALLKVTGEAEFAKGLKQGIEETKVPPSSVGEKGA